MTWEPTNLSAACPPQTPISACSSFGYTYLSLLVQLYAGSPDERKQEQCDRETGSTLTSGRQYDFIVVGAGAAGCVIANRLTENPKWKVLLLEAGLEEPDITSVPGLSTALLGSNIDWKYKTEPNGNSCTAQPGGKCSWPRGKTMGGSSSINSLAYIRGNKVDYDGWASMGNEGWSYEDVLPYFKKSERNMNIESLELDREYHDVKGEQYVSQAPYVDEPSLMITAAFHEAGLPISDPNGAEQVTTTQAQAIMLDGERVSANRAFIRPIRHTRTNLEIQTKAETTKILINKFKNAYGVVYVKGGKKYTAFAKKEIIVSCGAINSPKLLMLSGIGPKDHLKRLNIPVVKDLPVGKNLHDHVSFNGVILTFSNRTSTAATEEEILCAIREHAEAKMKRGPLAGNGPVNSITFMKSEPWLDEPDIQYQGNHIPDWREFIQDPITGERAAIMPTSFYDAVVQRPMNIVPKSRGELFLNESNPHGPPIMYPNYFGEESDVIPILKAVRIMLSLEDTDAYRSRGAYYVREKMPHCKVYDWGTDEYIICLMKSYTTTCHHQAGTCKMGPKWDKTAVVDNELRVYGVGRLRVIDASIIPCLMRGNTVAPTLMIGEKGVDYVIKYWRNRDKNFC